MCKRYLTVIFLIVSTLLTADIRAAEYSGKVRILENGNAAASEEYADIVIYFVPKTPASTAPLTQAREMRMEKKGFVPRVLPITVATQVDFPNFDPILHNTFSTSTNNSFDLGLYGGGDKKSHAFDNAGLVRVYCNVHHSMVGYILVLDTPYYTVTSTSGDFVLKNLPAISGELYVWHPRSEVVKKSIDLAQASLQKGEYQLDLTQRRVPKHLNKEGKSYRKSRERSY